jgi:hypothetical protein
MNERAAATVKINRYFGRQYQHILVNSFYLTWTPVTWWAYPHDIRDTVLDWFDATPLAGRVLAVGGVEEINYCLFEKFEDAAAFKLRWDGMELL